MTHLVWILGRSGLLGSAIGQTLQSVSPLQEWRGPVEHFSWRNPEELSVQLRLSVQALKETLADTPGSQWRIVWAAGNGTIRSLPEELAEETAAWKMLLTLLSTNLQDPPGRIFFASSSAVYGTNPDQLTEYTPPSPTAPYGEAKVMQEALLRNSITDMPLASGIIGRISTLYGEAQNVEKPQGLISHLSRSLLLRTPVHVYVPLDTIRDYLYAADAAEMIVQCLLCDLPSHERCTVKLIASEERTTIAVLIGLFRQMMKQPSRIIATTTPTITSFPRCTQLHSVVLPHIRPTRRTNLRDGIQRVHRFHLERLERGLLRS